ncbi:MAG: response regulator [Lunatimonas sp.]|uniref:response regulator n=1 Tax=Lunatimonas sp. TaxID=2060141 RepID=UPI00263B590C|nr:response regulator [Lunatimonas sp.]MCC5939483.1 response regulator [Lunatimonas sp.]
MSKIKLACVIDDDPLYNFGIKKLFEFTHFSENSLFYKNGQEAIEGLMAISEGENFPEVLLVDINMPIMNGWQFLEEYEKRNLKREVKIYVVSSSINQEEIDRANAYPFVSGYIFKPLTLEKVKELKETVEKG